jgi:HD-GYP domain-containing protein (c-di-GMP phosphodiesterase class II)
LEEVSRHPLEAEAVALQLSEAHALSLGERICALHAHLRRVVPVVDRLACALYDPEMDLLKTFVNSTVGGEPLRTYQYKLSASPSLMALKGEGQSRVIDDITEELKSETEHTRWVKSMGYRSSYTVPIFHQGAFEGFLFFDSCTPAAFTPEVVRQLDVYVNLIMLMVAHEITTVQALVGSVRVARDFTHLRDEETGTHLDRMSRICRLIARGLAKSHGLSDEFIEQLFLFSPLHDIGKVGIPDAVLRKPGSLNPAERAIMESHVALGVQMVDRLIEDFNLRTVAGVEILRNLVAGHHEFLDGSGYPKGSANGEIPLEARIVTVADIFDALTSKRAYKGAWSIDEALDSLDKMVAEGKLDADCVAALRENRDEAVAIIERFSEVAQEKT